jgi:hypothetical protein
MNMQSCYSFLRSNIYSPCSHLKTLARWVLIALTLIVIAGSCSRQNTQSTPIRLTLVDGGKGELLLQVGFDGGCGIRVVAVGHNGYEVYQNRKIVMSAMLNESGDSYEISGSATVRVQMESESAVWTFAGGDTELPLAIKRREAVKSRHKNP